MVALFFGKTLRMDASAPDRTDGAATPMMAQFFEAKRAAGDALVFFRMGDFYELFFDDALKAAAALDITLTKRGRHRGEDVPMCGVPVHAQETYLARLIRKGFRVAICEQIEQPDGAKKRGAKAVLKREIVRIVTPGTVIEDALLDPARNNFLGALAILRGGAEAALAWADISTGELWARSTSASSLAHDLSAIGLKELVVADHDPPSDEWRRTLEDARAGFALAPQPAAMFDSRAGERRLKEAFGVAALDAYGAFDRAALSALGALVAYASLTQAGRTPAFRPPKMADIAEIMIIDQATRRSLELTETQSGGREGSLLAAIDRTQTGPGARLLAARLAAPLTSPARINARLDAVAAFFDDAPLCDSVRACLKTAPDMARAVSRLSLKRGGPRDLAAIRDGIAVSGEIVRLLKDAPSMLSPPTEIAAARFALEARESGCAGLRLAFTRALGPDLPLLPRDGGFIAEGFDVALDETRSLREDSRRIIAKLEAEYRARADLRQLRIKHNSLLGYFIETPTASVDALLAGPIGRDLIRRQGLVGAARFSTPELSELDARIARAGEDAARREIDIFDRLADGALAEAVAIASMAEALAALDVFTSHAVGARERSWTRPLVDESRAFAVRMGRHPVVEDAAARVGAGPFTPNDCVLSDHDAPLLRLVTGPNMAGKSTYLRQNALIAILAQTGAFVPAEAAQIGVIDRVFSRVGAADDLARGRSTFMVEMVETAAILHQASDRSLVILDEIGRGTSTFDGLSIAWAAAEHLHDVNRCRGLFATHYHELTALAQSLPRLSNLSMRVREWKGDVVFLHEVAEGPADRSYGVAVARLAGMPSAAVKRAEFVLRSLEQQRGAARPLTDLPLFAAAPAAETALAAPAPCDALRRAFDAIDPDRLSPREALDALYRLKSAAAGTDAA